MVLRNWDKDEDTMKGTHQTWTSKDGRYSIYVVSPKMQSDRHLVNIYDAEEGKYVVYYKEFKTKKQALAFANAYMRTH